MNGVNMQGSTTQSSDLCLNSEAVKRRLKSRFVTAALVVIALGLSVFLVFTFGASVFGHGVVQAITIAVCVGITLFLFKWLYTDAARQLATSFEHISASQKQTLDAENTRTRFLETMSHELRTPLSSIIGSSELLNTSGTDLLNNKYINTISQNCRHMLGLVDGILDVTKIKSGRAEPSLSCTKLSGVIDEAINVASPHAIQKGISLSSSLDPDNTDWVITDPLRLRQILVNLLGNAIRHTDHGFVQIILENEPKNKAGMIALHVVDTGSGIASDEICRIFETHYQAGSAKNPGSAGLGLSICSELAAMLGGSISAESTLHEGSTFTLLIPKHRSFVIDQNAPGPTTDSNNKKPLAGKRIIVSEDCPDMLTLVQHILSNAGAAVVTTGSGKRLIAAMMSKTSPPDLALVDLGLEGVGGIAATQIIRSNGVTTPVLALTASTSPNDKAACEAAGFDGYLTKPIQAQELVRACAKWVAQSQAA
jgi:signal transduction histidine kinase/ActR/RegA family two-component response regulator